MRRNRRYVFRGSKTGKSVNHDIDNCFHSQKVEVGNGIRGITQVSHVTRCVLKSCATGCGDCALRLCLIPTIRICKSYCCVDTKSSTCSSSLSPISWSSVSFVFGCAICVWRWHWRMSACLHQKKDQTYMVYCCPVTRPIASLYCAFKSFILGDGQLRRVG